MWFFFGLISTLLCVAYFFVKKVKAAWKGEAGQCDGIDYQYKIVRSKNGIVGLKGGLESTDNFDFSIKLEKWYDRLFKRIGLSVEFQAGNDDFDRKFYIVSDDQRVFDCLAKEDDLRDEVQQLFQLHPKYCAYVKELRCNSSRLWLEYRCEGGFSTDNIPTIIETVVPTLRATADRLVKEASNGSEGFDRYTLRAAFILAVASGLGINGVCQLIFRIDWSALPYTIDRWELFSNALLLGGVVTALLLLSTICFLGRTSRAHLVFIEVLFIGAFGAFATSMEELRDMNIEMDTMPASKYTVVIHNKRIQHHRKGRTNYYLQVDDWLKKGNWKEIDVPYELYNDVREGDDIALYQKPGYLGYRWIERIQNW
jgi:hypothetical protein